MMQNMHPHSMRAFSFDAICSIRFDSVNLCEKMHRFRRIRKKKKVDAYASQNKNET